MPKHLQQQPQKFTVDEYFSDDTDLPHKIELIDGVIGPFSNQAKIALLANWGVDSIIALTGPEIWMTAIAARYSEK
jgi:hypothetical protein